MFGLDNTSGVSVMPPIADKLNANPLWFTEGGGGTSPSYPGKDWFNAIQAEIVNFIVASGLTPNKTDLTQLTQAVLKSIQKSASSFATDTGAANAYVCEYSPAITSRTEGQILRFEVANTNTGASTFNDGVGVVPLVGDAHAALQGGEMVAGGEASVQWNSSVGAGSYVLLSCTGAPLQIKNASKSQHAVAKGQVVTSDVMSNFRIALSSTAQTISAAVSTKLNFNVSIYDDIGEFVTASSRFVPINGGTYFFSAGFHGSGTTSANRTLTLFVNGVEHTRLQEQNAAQNVTTIAGSTTIKLAAGDYVEVYYYSSVTDTSNAMTYLSYFTGMRIK